MELPSRQWAITWPKPSVVDPDPGKILRDPGSSGSKMNLKWNYLVDGELSPGQNPVLWIRTREKSFRIRAALDPKWIEIELPSWRWAIPLPSPSVVDPDPGQIIPDPKLIRDGTAQSTVSHPLAKTRWCGSGSGKNHSGPAQLRIQNEFEIELLRQTDKIRQFLNEMLNSKLWISLQNFFPKSLCLVAVCKITYKTGIQK